MLSRRKARAEVFEWGKGRAEADPLERLRYAAACKLCLWHDHWAGGGSRYITIGDSLKLRFANHENTSAAHRMPDFNFVNRDPTENELKEIEDQIQYTEFCMKTAFAKHVGLTVPKLKKFLTADCYESVCENESYPRTFTEYVAVAPAFVKLEEFGITARIPVRQEHFSSEDFNGF